MAKTLIHVRVDSDALDGLEAIGANITPKPLNRSEMVNVAVRDYVARNGQQPKRKGKLPVSKS